MTKLNEIYKCVICGNLISVIEIGAGELVCCGQPMKLLKEKSQKTSVSEGLETKSQSTQDQGKEKHVPIVKINENNVKVTVGSTHHPMEEKHFIELIQLVKNNAIIAGKRLRPGETPEASFCLENTEGITARALCNVHGLWINK